MTECVPVQVCEPRVQDVLMGGCLTKTSVGECVGDERRGL